MSDPLQGPVRTPHQLAGNYAGPYSTPPPAPRTASDATDIRRTDPRATWHAASLLASGTGAAAAMAGIVLWLLIFPRQTPFPSYGSYASSVFLVLFAVTAGAMAVRFWCLARPVEPGYGQEADALATTASFAVGSLLLLQVATLFMMMAGSNRTSTFAGPFIGFFFFAGVVCAGLALSETADLVVRRPRAGTRLAFDRVCQVYILFAWIAVLSIYGQWERGV